MNKKLLISALIKYLIGLILVLVLVFVPAGTIYWWKGWLFVGTLFIPMLAVGVVLLLKAPNLLEKRLSAIEENDEQRAVLAFSGLMFIAAFVVAGLSYRFNWCTLPNSASWIGAISFLVSYMLYGEVLRENMYLSRTVEIQEDQHVISTGLYGIVRHPMYSTTVIMFLSIPIILGSIVALVVMLAYVPILIKRIRNEEEVLSRGLAGYAEYMTRVRWRLIPFLW